MKKQPRNESQPHQTNQPLVYNRSNIQRNTSKKKKITMDGPSQPQKKRVPEGKVTRKKITMDFSSDEQPQKKNHSPRSTRSNNGKGTVEQRNKKKKITMMTQKEGESGMYEMLGAIGTLKEKYDDRIKRKKNLEIITKRYEQWETILEGLELTIDDTKEQLDIVSSKPASKRTEEDDKEESRLERKLQNLEIYRPRAKKIIPHQPNFVSNLIETACKERLEKLKTNVLELEQTLKILEQQQNQKVPVIMKLLRDAKRNLKRFENELNPPPTPCISSSDESPQDRMTRILNQMKQIKKEYRGRGSEFNEALKSIRELCSSYSKLESKFEDGSVRLEQMKKIEQYCQTFEKYKQVLLERGETIRQLIDELDSIPSHLKDSEFSDLERTIMNTSNQLEHYILKLQTSNTYKPPPNVSLTDHLVNNAAEKRLKELREKMKDFHETMKILEGQGNMKTIETYQVLMSQEERKLDRMKRVAEEMGLDHLSLLLDEKKPKSKQQPKILITGGTVLHIGGGGQRQQQPQPQMQMKQTKEPSMTNQNQSTMMDMEKKEKQDGNQQIQNSGGSPRVVINGGSQVRITGGSQVKIDGSGISITNQGNPVECKTQ